MRHGEHVRGAREAYEVEEADCVATTVSKPSHDNLSIAGGSRDASWQRCAVAMLPPGGEVYVRPDMAAGVPCVLPQNRGGWPLPRAYEGGRSGEEKGSKDGREAGAVLFSRNGTCSVSSDDGGGFLQSTPGSSCSASSPVSAMTQRASVTGLLVARDSRLRQHKVLAPTALEKSSGRSQRKRT